MEAVEAEHQIAVVFLAVALPSLVRIDVEVRGDYVSATMEVIFRADVGDRNAAKRTSPRKTWEPTYLAC